MAAGSVIGTTFIGDVHGWADRLSSVLEQVAGPVVFLGDVIDRGPDVPRVLDLVRERCARGDRCVMGNHEYMLVRALGHPDSGHPGNARDFARWRSNFSGEPVMRAYGVDSAAGLRRALGDHLDWLAQLPWVVTGEDWIAVHAGLAATESWQPQVAALALGWKAEEQNLMAIFDKSRARVIPHDLPPGWVVISGHTPVTEAVTSRGRMLCDTSGGLAMRPLSAVHWPSTRVVSALS